MDAILFASGSAVGAVLAWLVVRGGPSRSTVLALNGIACGLFGALGSASLGANMPAVEFGFGLLGTAAPLTLCLNRSVIGSVGIPATVRHLAVGLAFALVSGIGCATVGFVAVHGVRQISGKERRGIHVGCPSTVSPESVRISTAVS
ncbi:hypothetical protein [Mycobacterium servetii]|uniref:Fluoride ion transporter CrcB n=1 Tax=Mycobacterium servetii TaxID=3237418 RepID=A0ABV4BXR4_9MYCO